VSIEDRSRSKDLLNLQTNLISEEIKYLDSHLRHYDELSFKIKGWAITLWSGIVAFGAKEGLWMVVITSIPISVSFWILDAYFKQYQRRSMERMRAIELFLDSTGFFEGKGLDAAFMSGRLVDFPVHDPIGSRTRRIDKSFEDKYKRRTNFWKCMTVPNVLYFYLLPLITSIIVIVLMK